MNVLSLYDGISCGMIALERAGFNVANYYAAEIDKYATKISEANYPNIIRLGDVTKWGEWGIDWGSVDLVLAGFPCQAWSMAGQQQGDKDPRGALFWTTLDIIKNVKAHNPKAKFLMENVKMKKDFENYITFHTEQALGYVEKTLINSALVSAQNRNRFYWTNFKVTQPEDKGILLKDIIEDEQYSVPFDLMERVRDGLIKSEQNLKGESQTLTRAVKNTKGGYDKANSLTACSYKGMGTNGMTNVLVCGAIRGRYIIDGKRQDHKMPTAGLTEQRLELRKDDKTNTLTTVQKDNVLVYRPVKMFDIANGGIGNRVYSIDGKSPTLLAQSGGKAGVGSVLINQSAAKQGKAYTLTASYSGAGAWNSIERKQRTMLPVKETNEEHPNVYNGVLYRKLTPLECERLQTLPDNYTAHVSNTQRYKSIGNGWTVDVIAHILRGAF